MRGQHRQPAIRTQKYDSGASGKFPVRNPALCLYDSQSACSHNVGLLLAYVGVSSCLWCLKSSALSRQQCVGLSLAFAGVDSVRYDVQTRGEVSARLNVVQADT
jgi:hypothetical protein